MSERPFLKKHLVVTMTLGVLLVIFGIAMLTTGGRLFVILMGIGLVFSGLSTLEVLFSLSRDLKESQVKFAGKARTLAIVKSLVSILLGIVAILYSKESLKVLMYLMGAQMAVSALIGLYDAIIVKRTTGFPVSSLVTDAVFALIIAVVLFVFPSGTGKLIAAVIACILVVSGLALFFWAFRVRKLDKEFLATNVEVLDEKK